MDKTIKKIIAVVIFTLLCIYVSNISRKQYLATIESIEYKNNKITISFDTLYDGEIKCVLKGNKTETFKSTNNTCTIDPTEGGTLYLYQGSNLLNKPDENITNILEDEYYLIAGQKFDTSIFNNDELDKHPILVGNESILNVVGNDVEAKGNGETFIFIGNHIVKVKVTDLLVDKPNVFNDNKKFLTCGNFTDDDNNLIDDYLKYYINTAGYKTRAGVVEAARFLTLNFPYKIYYFGENGRLTSNGIDGEGRYYHIGLYLSNAKTKEIKKSSSTPACWSCYLPVGEENVGYNGLDCSGFVTWAILNGGFDCGDIGAGISPYKNLTSLGELKKNSNDLLKDIKVGDLVHNNEVDGHIGIIVGIDDKNYYVAEAVAWRGKNGVGISTFDSNSFINTWTEVVLMDSYYKNDGNLTNMWY